MRERRNAVDYSVLMSLLMEIDALSCMVDALKRHVDAVRRDVCAELDALELHRSTVGAVGEAATP